MITALGSFEHGQCDNCSEICDDLFMGLCCECWEKELGLGFVEYKRRPTFDDD